MTHVFNTNSEYSIIHVWCKWFQPKSVTSYRADKFVDRRVDGRAEADGQTQATTMPLRPERPWDNKTDIVILDGESFRLTLHIDVFFMVAYTFSLQEQQT